MAEIGTFTQIFSFIVLIFDISPVCVTRSVLTDFGPYTTVGPLRIGDDVITKDSLFVIIVEIDTRIYKTYPKLDYTIVHPKYPRDSLSSIYIMQ